MEPSVILMPNWIGDMLLALSIVMRMPEKRLSATTLLVPEQMASLVRLLSDLPQLPFARSSSGERRRTVSEIHHKGFRTIYLLPYSFSSAWLAMQTGIPRRRGLSRDLRGWLLTDPLPGNLRDRTHHLIREYAEILELPYIAPESWDGIQMDADNKYAGAIVLCPGAKYGPSKKWSHFPELAQLLHNNRIVVLGTADDRDSAAEIVQSARNRVTDLTGKTSLKQAAAVMAGARVVVSNDSGLMHLAAFLGVPVVGLFGSTSPVWTRPLGKRTAVLSSSESCAPCFKRTCKYGHYRCLENITTDDVAVEIGKLTGTLHIAQAKGGPAYENKKSDGHINLESG